MDYTEAVLRYMPFEYWETGARASLKRFVGKEEKGKKNKEDGKDVVVDPGNSEEVDELLSMVKPETFKSIDKSDISFIHIVDCHISTCETKKAEEQFNILHDAFKNSHVQSEKQDRVFSAYSNWFKRRFQDSFNDFMICLQVDPSDLFVCKRAQLMALLGGFNEKILSPPLAIKDHHTDSPYFSGMLSFGYEQAGKYEDAEKIAKEGIKKSEKLNDHDFWLHHSYAHALYFQGPDRLKEGIEFLKTHAPQWNRNIVMDFLYTHLWWHLSLLLVENHDLDGAIAVYDEYLWPEEMSDDDQFKNDVQVQLNAMELLWKMQVFLDSKALYHSKNFNAEVLKDRWTKVIKVSLKRAGKHDDPLHELLLYRGLLATNHLDDAEKLFEGIQKDFQNSNPFFCEVVNLVRTICAGSTENQTSAHLTQEEARKKLLAIEPKWGEALGNSVEQRGILKEIATNYIVVCGEAQASYSSQSDAKKTKL